MFDFKRLSEKIIKKLLQDSPQECKLNLSFCLFDDKYCFNKSFCLLLLEIPKRHIKHTQAKQNHLFSKLTQASFYLYPVMKSCFRKCKIKGT